MNFSMIFRPIWMKGYFLTKTNWLLNYFSSAHSFYFWMSFIFKELLICRSVVKKIQKWLIQNNLRMLLSTNLLRLGYDKCSYTTLSQQTVYREQVSVTNFPEKDRLCSCARWPGFSIICRIFDLDHGGWCIQAVHVFKALDSEEF